MNRKLKKLVPLRVQQRAYRTLPAPVWRVLREVGTGTTALQRRAVEARLEKLRLAAQNDVDGVLTAVRYRGEHLVARPVERFRAVDVLAESAAFVLDALEAKGIDYLVVDARVARRRIVAVAGTDRDAAWAALVE